MSRASRVRTVAVFALLFFSALAQDASDNPVAVNVATFVVTDEGTLVASTTAAPG